MDGRSRASRIGPLLVLALAPWLCGAGSRELGGTLLQDAGRPAPDEVVLSSTSDAVSRSTFSIPSAAARASAPNLTAKGLPVIFSNDRRNKPPLSGGVVVDGKGKSVAVGVGARLDEGRTLETVIWGGGGAVIGSIAGPLGAIVGGAVGAAVGMVIGTVMPRRQRSPTFRD